MEKEKPLLMAWASMAASETGFFVFIEVSADKSNRLNSEENSAILSARIQPNTSKIIGKCFILQMDNDPQQILKAIQDFKAKNRNVLQ